MCIASEVDSLWHIAAHRLHPNDRHRREENLRDALSDFPSVTVPARTLHEQAATVDAVLGRLLVVILLHHFKIEILWGER